MHRNRTKESKWRQQEDEFLDMENPSKFMKEKKYNVHLLGKTPKQNQYLNSLYQNTLIIASGPAGTGKTYLATGYAYKELMKGTFEKIIISRSNIPTGKSLGYFPGTIEEKITPWLQQILNYITDFSGNKSITDLLLKNKQLLMIPLETMRGRSFDNSCVLVDESQNLTIEELKCISTRIGENSKLVLCGDGAQSDLKTKDFDLFTNLLKRYEIQNTDIIKFTRDDCVRSGLCADLIRMFELAQI